MNEDNKNMNFENNDASANEPEAVEAELEVVEAEAATSDGADASESEPEISMAGARGRGIGKRLIKIAIAVLSLLVVLSLVATVSYAAVTNYVLFPDFDEALANSLENKFDLGTEFDFSALANEGKIELEMYPDEEEKENTDIDKVIASISYSGLSEMSAKLTIGDEVANAYVSEDAIAANVEGFEDGKFYGISLKDIVERLEGSFFDPDQESDYVQLTDDQFDELEDMLENFIEMGENEKEYQKDVALLLGVIEKAFKESSLSEHEISYGGIKVFGEERSARCKRYDFDLDDIADFIECLADEFDDPSKRLEEAVKNLFDDDASPFAQILSGYDCDDIVDELDDLVDEIDDIDEDMEFTVLLAYSSNAFTAIQVKAEIGEEMTVIATVDFGESPKKEKGIVINVDVTSIPNNEKVSVRFSTELEEKDDGSEATMMLCVELPDQKNEIVLSAEFDREDEKAIISANTKITVKEGDDELTTEADEQELFKFTFKMLDSKSKFSLTVDELVANGEKAEDIGGEITLSFYKKPDRTRMPGFEDLLDMKVRSFDRLCGDLEDYLEELGEEYEDMFDIDVSGLVPEISVPGTKPAPEVDDDIGIIGGEGNNNTAAPVSGIADGDYSYIELEAGYSENYRFSGNKYYYNVYDATADEYLWNESGTFYLSGNSEITFCPDYGEAYSTPIEIYSDRIVIFDISYRKT